MNRLGDAIIGNTPFWALTISAIVMLVTSLLLPPTGKIDPSVLEGVGEVLGFFALWTVVFALKNGTTTTVKHNGTEVTIDRNGNE